MRLMACLFLAVALGGCGTPSFLITPVSNTHELQEVTLKDGHSFLRTKILIIPVEGTLVNAESGGFLQASENPLSLFVEELDDAAADDSVKAIVLRVNSPGGTVTASDTMYDALMRFKARTHKPVIASTQELAASGAYYVCCGADKIVVSPTSLVGCIGVIFEAVEFSGTLDKLGIKAEAIKTGELKDMGSPLKHVTPHEREVMQQMVDEYFVRFKEVVTSHRPIKDDQTLALVTDGRVFTGDDAVKLGLADQAGRLDDAIAIAKEMANVNGAAVVIYKHPYGYAGSIYASTAIPEPKTSQMELKLPLSESPLLPSGFYYLWKP